MCGAPQPFEGLHLVPSLPSLQGGANEMLCATIPAYIAWDLALMYLSLHPVAAWLPCSVLGLTPTDYCHACPDGGFEYTVLSIFFIFPQLPPCMPRCGTLQTVLDMLLMFPFHMHFMRLQHEASLA